MTALCTEDYCVYLRVGCKCNGRHNPTEKQEQETKKQTILTGDKRTGNDIQNGQRVSRHSLPTLLYFLFSPPHIFFNSILCRPTNGTLAFAPTAQANPQAKAKEPFFANAPLRLLKIIWLLFILQNEILKIINLSLRLDIIWTNEQNKRSVGRKRH